MKNIITSLFLLFVLTTVAKAQDSVSNVKYRRSYWVDFGTGLGGQYGANNFLIHAEIARGKVLTYAYDNTRRLKEDIDGIASDSRSLLFGKVIKGKSGLIRFSVGLSLTKVKKYDYTFTGNRCTFADWLGSLFGGTCTPTVPTYDVEVTEKSTVGIPLDVQFMLSSKWGGIGINPHVNFNSKFTYVSLTLQASLGRIR